MIRIPFFDLIVYPILPCGSRVNSPPPCCGRPISAGTSRLRAGSPAARDRVQLEKWGLKLKKSPKVWKNTFRDSHPQRLSSERSVRSWGRCGSWPPMPPIAGSRPSGRTWDSCSASWPSPRSKGWRDTKNRKFTESSFMSGLTYRPPRPYCDWP